MQKLLILALAGFVAQLVDGSLGMAYGVTSTSLLLLLGIAPAVASASVHMAEVVTTAASGISHMRFGNVDRILVRRLILPGSAGAFIGACFLSSLPGDVIKPYIAIFLFLLGIYVMWRFLFNRRHAVHQPNTSPKFLFPLGLSAGFLDATGGGGWGPLSTPILMSRHGMETRKVIGSVDTSEFFIAVSATLGFLISLGWSNVSWTWVVALMIGGIVAAPIAAWLVRVIPSHLLGVTVGGMIIFTNTQTLLTGFSFIPSTWHTVIYVFVVLCWGGAIGLAVYRYRKGYYQETSSHR